MNQINQQKRKPHFNWSHWGNVCFTLQLNAVCKSQMLCVPCITKVCLTPEDQFKSAQANWPSHTLLYMHNPSKCQHPHYLQQLGPHSRGHYKTNMNFPQNVNKSYANKLSVYLYIGCKTWTFDSTAVDNIKKKI